MKNIEIPIGPEKSFVYRCFEILPGVLSWFVLILPFVLSIVNVRLLAILMISFLLLWFGRAVGINIRVIQGWRTMKQHEKLPWQDMIVDLKSPSLKGTFPSWHYDHKKRLALKPGPIKAENVIHAVIIATVSESRGVLEPTIKAVIDSDFDKKRIILLLAYEARAGHETKERAESLIAEYKDQFLFAEAVGHPDGIPNEVRGKGGNITFAGKRLEEIVANRGLDPLNVLVTTLDSDNRPHNQYFACLTYTYALCSTPKFLSFQPVPMFTNNIWDAPAPMRVIATGNSFWMIVQALRPHMLRNFSAHAQPLASLIDTDFWSVRTIVEDGHQYWRTYFRYDGRHEVIPLFVPIFQDAVLAETLPKTLKAQFIQIRRWAWGASDIAYVAHKGFFEKNKAPKTDTLFKLLRLMEGHLNWAVAPLILAFGALIPIYINSDDYIANQLPLIASRIQTIALVGGIVTLYLSLRALPPKPARYRHHRTVWMVLQWVLLPITTITYSAMAAITSQTRLMLGKYLGSFDVTVKAVKTDSGTSTKDIHSKVSS